MAGGASDFPAPTEDHIARCRRAIEGQMVAHGVDTHAQGVQSFLDHQARVQAQSERAQLHLHSLRHPEKT